MRRSSSSEIRKLPGSPVSGERSRIAFERRIDCGVDPHAASLREAQRRGCYRHLIQSDGARLPFPDSSFGSAFSNSVLEHIPHLDQVLAEVGRVLRPGAPFVFTVPNPGYRRDLSVPEGLRARTRPEDRKNWAMP